MPFVGRVVGEIVADEPHVPNSHARIAFRADRDGAIHIISRTGVLIGHPGELGTVNLTAADVETLGVSDLKKELAARGETTTGGEFQLKTRLTDYLR